MEHYFSEQPENSPSSFEALLALLDFPASPELSEVRGILLELLKNPTADTQSLQSAWEAFSNAIESISENPELEQHAHTKLQIGAIVYKALLFKEAGNNIRYAQELDDAELYAFNAGILEISVPLNTELEAVAETLPHDAPEVIVLKLRGKIRGDDRLTFLDSISDGEDFDVVLGDAFGMLDDAGYDADYVLKRSGLTE